MRTVRLTRRRATLAVIAVAAIVLAFLMRLVVLQVVQADELNAQSTQQRMMISQVPGVRGSILAADGTVLASSSVRYDITVSPALVVALNPELTAEDENGQEYALTAQVAATQLGEALGMTQADVLKPINDALAINPESQFAYIKQGVDAQALERVRALDLPYIFWEEQQTRSYPNGQIAGNIVGFMGGDGSPLEGVEAAYDQCLAGQNGETSYQGSASWVRLPGSENVISEPVAGGDVQLTIDPELQYYTQEVLAQQVTTVGAPSGNALVVEAETGNIVAAAEYPTVDPNTPSASDAQYRGSRIFRDPFEPGSIMKPITASMLFDAGVATLDDTVLAPYELRKNGAVFSDSNPHDPMNLTLPGVITESSNTGIALFGERLSAEQRYDYLMKYGFGTSTAVNYPGEESGIVHPSENWDPQTNYATMFGQGLTTTQAQIASAYQTIANDGVQKPLRLVSGCTAADGTVTPTASGEERRVISPEAALQTQMSIETMAQEGWLTSQTKIDGYRIGTKTGTAQMSDGNGQYSSSYIVSLAGMAPMDDPKYVVIVTIQNPATINSSAATAPAWQAIMSQTLQLNKIAPSTEPAPDLPVTK